MSYERQSFIMYYLKQFINSDFAIALLIGLVIAAIFANYLIFSDVVDILKAQIH